MLIIAWIILGMLDLPYSRGLAATRDFLDSVCRPYVSLFRRYMPAIGPLDLSPMVAVLALQLARYVLIVFLGI
jgi:uncharacterized protein YggT (Ycf19 family)